MNMKCEYEIINQQITDSLCVVISYRCKNCKKVVKKAARVPSRTCSKKIKCYF